MADETPRYGRSPWLEPADFDPAQRAFYDELVSGPRDTSAITDDRGRLLGAFNARLLNPEVGAAVQKLGASLRFGSVLTGRERELAILEVARAARGSYEWNAHVRAGRKAGLTDEQLDAVLAGEDRDDFSAEETAVRRLARTLATDGDLGDEDFAAAEAAMGLPKLFTIVSIVGHYLHTAMSMKVWRVPLREGDPDVFGTGR